MKSPIRLLVLSVLLFLPGSYLLAGSATWNANPISNDWDDANNWTPQTVPQEETDIATFGVSAITYPFFTNWTDLNLSEILFSSGASSYTIGGSRLDLFGPGLVNNSGIIQTIDTDYGFAFWGSSRAGDNATYNVYEDSYYVESFFYDESSAGSATFIVNGVSEHNHIPGQLDFFVNSSGADSTIMAEGSTLYGGEVGFGDFSTAGNCQIMVGENASVGFGDYAIGGTATILADGGRIYFDDNSNGANAAVTATNGSVVDLSRHTATALMELDSLTTDPTSTVTLGGSVMTFMEPSDGASSTSTLAGVISGRGGLAINEGVTVTLSAINTYSGGTIVTGGKLILGRTSGSATGSGPVTVVDGSLGGNGIIAGPLTLGGGQLKQNAQLDPMIAKPVALKIKAPLTFLDRSTYQWRLIPNKASAVEVAAKGINIDNGALFSPFPNVPANLPIGTVFTPLRNTAKTPINGNFNNLPDGVTIVSGGNTLLANYEGGDGNDFTLTVIQNSQSIRPNPRH